MKDKAKKQKGPSKKKKEEKLDHLEILELEITAYNEMYGTRYSHGTYVAAKARGWLNPIPVITK